MDFVAGEFEIRLHTFETDEVSLKTVQGYIAEESGLAYYHEEVASEENGVYIVTHLASGFDIGYHLFHEEDTRAFIERLASLWDWHVPAKEIWDKPPEERRKVREALLETTLSAFASGRKRMGERYAQLIAKSQVIAQEMVVTTVASSGEHT